MHIITWDCSSKLVGAFEVCEGDKVNGSTVDGGTTGPKIKIQGRKMNSINSIIIPEFGISF